MNREIKFRLHDQEGNIIGYEIHEKNEYGCWQIYHTSLRNDWEDNNVKRLVRDGYFIAAKTKCEYTGQKDKNGKEIYEGDILSEMWKVEVYKDRNTGAFMVIFHVNPEVNKPMTLYDYLKRREKAGTIDRDGMVTGSIYENINLLQ